MNYIPYNCFPNISVTKSNFYMRSADTKSNHMSYTYFSMKVAERGFFSLSGEALVHAYCPAAYPDAQAQWRLYPPSSPVTSITSPMK